MKGDVPGWSASSAVRGLYAVEYGSTSQRQRSSMLMASRLRDGSLFPKRQKDRESDAFEVLTFLADSYFFPEIIRRCERYDACCDDELLHSGTECGVEDAGCTGDGGLEQRQVFGKSEKLKDPMHWHNEHRG